MKSHEPKGNARAVRSTGCESLVRLSFEKSNAQESTTTKRLA
jgi:hypothetical protein